LLSVPHEPSGKHASDAVHWTCAVHAMHASLLQIGVVFPHAPSSESVHATQTPPVSHTGALVLVHCVLPVHAIVPPSLLPLPSAQLLSMWPVQ
jgi:hypothetical protein